MINGTGRHEHYILFYYIEVEAIFIRYSIRSWAKNRKHKTRIYIYIFIYVIQYVYIYILVTIRVSTRIIWDFFFLTFFSSVLASSIILLLSHMYVVHNVAFLTMYAHKIILKKKKSMFTRVYYISEHCGRFSHRWEFTPSRPVTDRDSTWTDNTFQARRTVTTRECHTSRGVRCRWFGDLHIINITRMHGKHRSSSLNYGNRFQIQKRFE